MALALAEEEDINIVIANDPDADRFCAAERVGGKWHVFTGNEIGIILADHVFQRYKSRPGFNPGNPRRTLSATLSLLSSVLVSVFSGSGLIVERLAMLSSAVSSKMLSHMAKAEGFHHEETLTGFKWLGNKTLVLVSQGYEAPYAFEEAIGYMFFDIVRDKDGIAAAAVFLRLVVEMYERGGTIVGYLNELYQRYALFLFLCVCGGGLMMGRYGYFASRNSYVICEDPGMMTRAFYKLRHSTSSQISYIRVFNTFPVKRIKDVSLNYDSVTTCEPEDKAVSPSSEMISFELEGDVVMTLRGSGTEPKLKYYIEARGATMEEAESVAEGVEIALRVVFREFGLEG